MIAASHVQRLEAARRHGKSSMIGLAAVAVLVGCCAVAEKSLLRVYAVTSGVVVLQVDGVESAECEPDMACVYTTVASPRASHRRKAHVKHTSSPRQRDSARYGAKHSDHGAAQGTDTKTSRSQPNKAITAPPSPLAAATPSPAHRAVSCLSSTYRRSTPRHPPVAAGPACAAWRKWRRPRRLALRCGALHGDVVPCVVARRNASRCLATAASCAPHFVGWEGRGPEVSVWRRYWNGVF